MFALQARTWLDFPPPCSFMDDCLAALRNADHSKLLEDLPRLAVIIAIEAGACGQQVNFKQDNIESLLALRGVGSQVLLQDIARTRSGKGFGRAFRLPLPQGTLRVVPAYKHLGAQAIASVLLAAELAARWQLSLMTARALRNLLRSNAYHIAPKPTPCQGTLLFASLLCNRHVESSYSCQTSLASKGVL